MSACAIDENKILIAAAIDEDAYGHPDITRFDGTDWKRIHHPENPKSNLY